MFDEVAFDRARQTALDMADQRWERIEERASVPAAHARQDPAAAGMSLRLAWVGQLLQASGVREIICVDVHSPEASRALGLPVRSILSSGHASAARQPGSSTWRSAVLRARRHTVLSRRRRRQARVIPGAPLLAPVLEEMPAVRCP